jgi:hypothetical protein
VSNFVLRPKKLLFCTTATEVDSSIWYGLLRRWSARRPDQAVNRAAPRVNRNAPAGDHRPTAKQSAHFFGGRLREFQNWKKQGECFGYCER